LSEAPPTGRLRLAIAIADPDLADRLVEMLADVAGLQLVGPGDAADVALTSARVAPIDEFDPAITPRETQVLALLAEGMSNRGIALRLGISIHTAKFHVKALLDKLDAVGRTDAVAHAARLGLIQL
jgi:DNA-binding CsgD family transcriptional regulator